MARFPNGHADEDGFNGVVQLGSAGSSLFPPPVQEASPESGSISFRENAKAQLKNVYQNLGRVP